MWVGGFYRYLFSICLFFARWFDTLLHRIVVVGGSVFNIVCHVIDFGHLPRVMNERAARL